MKNNYIVTVVFTLLLNTLGFAQEKNVFHDGDFWKSKPTKTIIKAKIAEGNDPTAFNSYAFDATVFAIMNDAPDESILYLLSLPGNEVDKLTHDARNYLMWAAYRGNVNMVNHLLNEGSDINLVDAHDLTALTFAANAGQLNPALYDRLIEGGADILENNGHANALLLLCLHVSHISELDYFIKKGMSIKSKDNLGNSAFIYASRGGNISFMNELIKADVDYKSLNNENANAMIYAGYGRRGNTNGIEVYEFLEKLGLNANVVTSKGVNPLHSIAYRTKDTTVYDFFMERGVDINQVNEDGNTVFLNALSGGNTEISNYLLPKVNDINLKNKKGYSALSYAALNYATQKSNADFFELLLEKGAGINVTDAKGDNLVYHFFTMYDELSSERKDYFFGVFKANNMSLTNTYSGGNTLYHVAVEENQNTLLLKAEELSIDINKKNENGLAPIHLAAMKAKDTSTIQWLIEHGADVKQLTDFDESVYDLAKENEILAKSGVNIDFLK